MADKMNKTVNVNEDTIICYSPSMVTTAGLLQGEYPLHFSLPLFVLQLILVIVTTRLLVFLLKPFRQPRVVSEILGGIILGPSVFGKSEAFATIFFPLRSVMVLETMANIGLLYFLFLVGLEMDMGVVRRSGRKSFFIAACGMIVPFAIGAAFSFFVNTQRKQHSFILFLGIALSVTAFPVLARILTELKLFNTELGQIAMSAGLLSDIFAWIFLAFSLALTEGYSSRLTSFWVIISSTCFIAFCVFVVRPAISWMIKKTPEGESFSDNQLCLVLTGVLISGFITDIIGTHSVLGAFVFGLIIPNGPLGVTILDKLEDFISGILLPLYFANSGLKTNITVIEASTWGMLFLIIVLALAGKVAGTLLVCKYYQIPTREGTVLGLLMNTKGLVEMIILNLGKDQQVLDDRSFTIMVVTAVIMTGIITPLASAIYRPTRISLLPYKLRTLQMSKLDAELQVMVCVHTPQNVPTIINLLEASYPTKKSPMYIYVLHLIELTGRSSMLLVHNTRKAGRPALNRAQAQSNHIINAFENFRQEVGCISIHPLTAVSPYATMHKDICNLAEEKRVAFIIIPFHKLQTVDGGMETPNPARQIVNKNLLANAPCSVGILVDRGLNGPTHSSNNEEFLQVAILFFGGPDDREALSYAWRMSGHPTVRLTIMRFVPNKDAADTSTHMNDSRNLAVENGTDRDKQLDEQIINEFRSRNAHNESIVYTEKVVNNGEETVTAVRLMGNIHNLFIVGRRQGIVSPLTAGLTEWSECPELGPIGDILASSDFAATTSVLVVQQYIGEGTQEGLNTPDSLDEFHHKQPFSP